MGSACCVAAARDQTIPHRAGGEALHRSSIDSPSLSFRWDRRCVADKIENSSYQVSRGISRNVSMELKGSLSSERGNLSDGGSLMENFGTPTSLKSPAHEAADVNLMTPHSGKFLEWIGIVGVRKLVLFRRCNALNYYWSLTTIGSFQIKNTFCWNLKLNLICFHQ